MSLKAELETWAAALKAYDEEDFEKALEGFTRIGDSSKILTNMGLIYATLGEHEAAVEQFIQATGLDQYLAVAYFQCGVSNFLLGRYELALKDFEEALLYLRGNQAINYEQLGLKFKLFSAEVLFNKGLSQIYMGRIAEGLADMQEARKDKATEEHSVIDDAIQDQGEGYTVFSIPVGVLYRPSESKMKNSKAKDYMGTAKLVAAADSSDAFTTFTGVTRLRNGVTPAGVFIDQDSAPALSRSATAPAPVVPRQDPAPVARAGAGLSRAQTTLNVPADARERIAGLSAGGPPSRTVTPAGGRSSPPTGIGGGPTRSLTITRSNPSSGPSSAVEERDDRGLRGPAGPPISAQPPAKEPSSRLTEFYDDYLDSYGGEEEEAPPLPTNNAAQKQDRVGQWARTNATPNNAPPSRAQSTKAPPSAYGGSTVGPAPSMRRKLTRRGTQNRARGATQSYYEEEEEGYASGDYDEGPFELVKIRLKLHYQDDVRGMALSPETTFDDFMYKITSKFNKPANGLILKFKDEDGGKVSLRDESDYELAIETARESAKGKPEGRLELWCLDAN